VWNGGSQGEPELLASCYRRALEIADELGARSVAFPAISTGVYRFPRELAARIAVETVRSVSTQVEVVRLVAFDQETYDLYWHLLDSSSLLPPRGGGGPPGPEGGNDASSE
jgi:O-acetyl-ADP-ribose deacetylase (regulator of RNase III)